MKRSDKIFAMALIILFLFVGYVVLDANKYAATVRVIAGEEKVGINPTTERLDFGDLTRGKALMRTVTIQNNTPVAMYIVVAKTGAIKDLIKVNQNYFRLAPETTTKLEFNAYIPASAEVNRRYDGRVYLFKIPTL